MRLWIIMLNIFTFLTAQISFALQPKELAAYNEFFMKSELSKRAVPLADLHAKFARNFPPEVRQQLDLFIKENPKFTLPKLNVQKLGQEVQISYATPKEKMVIRTTSNSKTNWASMVGVINGKEVKTDIAYSDFKNAAQGVYDFRNQELRKKPSLLNAKQFNLLSKRDKIEYMKRLRALLAAAEAVQNSFNSPKKVSTLFDFFVEPAWAVGVVVEEEPVAAPLNTAADGVTEVSDDSANLDKSKKGKRRGPTKSQGSGKLAGSPCVIAGWISQYGTPKGKMTCMYPSEYKDDGCGADSIRCNPELYGKKVHCIANVGGSVDINATANCNKKVPIIESLPEKESVKDEKSFNSYRDEKVKSLVESLQLKCESIEANLDKGMALKDQAPTCAALRERIQEISKLVCDQYAVEYNQPSLCKAPTPPSPIPPEPVQPAPPPVTSPCPSPGADGGGNGEQKQECPIPPPTTPVPPPTKISPEFCEKLKGHGQVSCENGWVVKTQCTEANTGKSITVYHCGCNDGYIGVSDHQLPADLYPNRCTTSKEPEKEKNKKSSSGGSSGGWKKALPYLVALGVLGGIGWLALGKKKDRNTAANPLVQAAGTAVNTPVAEATGDTTTGNTTGGTTTTTGGTATGGSPQAPPAFGNQRKDAGKVPKTGK